MCLFCRSPTMITTLRNLGALYRRQGKMIASDALEACSAQGRLQNVVNTEASGANVSWSIDRARQYVRGRVTDAMTHLHRTDGDTIVETDSAAP